MVGTCGPHVPAAPGSWPHRATAYPNTASTFLRAQLSPMKKEKKKFCYQERSPWAPSVSEERLVRSSDCLARSLKGRGTPYSEITWRNHEETYFSGPDGRFCLVGVTRGSGPLLFSVRQPVPPLPCKPLLSRAHAPCFPLLAHPRAGTQALSLFKLNAYCHKDTEG